MMSFFPSLKWWESPCVFQIAQPLLSNLLRGDEGSYSPVSLLFGAQGSISSGQPAGFDEPCGGVRFSALGKFFFPSLS
jgi:hypothetical protein